MHEMKHSEIWGDVKNLNEDLCTSSVCASVFSHSAKGCEGGDIYYFSTCGGNMLTRFMVADVVGHGEEVSEFSQYVLKVMKENSGNLNTSDLLGMLNSKIMKEGIHALTTAAMAAIYTQDSNLYLSYAGHPPVFYLPKGETEWRTLTLESRSGAYLPLGVQESVFYEGSRVPVSKGDKVFMYTDGITEMKNTAGRMFGAEKLRTVLNQYGKEHVMEIKEGVVKELETFADKQWDQDDFTILAAEIIDY